MVDQSGKGHDLKFEGKNKKFHNHVSTGPKRGPRTFKDRADLWGYKWFYKRTALETSEFLKNDCLKLKCTLAIEVSAREYARLHSAAVPESELSFQFGALLENQEDSDVTFDGAGEKFHAHKLVLVARSPVFRANFFDSSERNNEIFITDMEPTVFKRLLPAADAYGLWRLRLLCESKLWNNISVGTVVSTLVLAESCHATQLKAACLKFAARNLAEVMRSKGLEYLNEKCPSLHSELLETVAGFKDDFISRESRSSVWTQISDGTYTRDKRVRP